MSTDRIIQENDYFSRRGVHEQYYSAYEIPLYLLKELPLNKNAEIIDIGCGFGQTLLKLKQLGYTNVKGIDISNESVDFCQKNGLNVAKIENITDYQNLIFAKNDFAIMSHVLEHIEKNKIIDTLKVIKSEILSENGKLCVMVPNAQSNTGPYWMFEDFTHTWLFTAGSLIYVLKSAGFKTVYFLDIYGTMQSNFMIKNLKAFFLKFYKFKVWFWNHVTGSPFHKPSPVIYTWELKAIASS